MLIGNQADSNRILSESITPELVRYRSIDKWNGELPRFFGAQGPLPFIDVGEPKKCVPLPGTNSCVGPATVTSTGVAPGSNVITYQTPSVGSAR